MLSVSLEWYFFSEQAQYPVAFKQLRAKIWAKFHQMDKKVLLWRSLMIPDLICLHFLLRAIYETWIRQCHLLLLTWVDWLNSLRWLLIYRDRWIHWNRLIITCSIRTYLLVFAFSDRTFYFTEQQGLARWSKECLACFWQESVWGSLCFTLAQFLFLDWFWLLLTWWFE